MFYSKHMFAILVKKNNPFFNLYIFLCFSYILNISIIGIYYF